MSKGLEALEEIKNARLIDHVEIKEGLFSNKLLGYKRRYGEDVFYKQIPIIEKELKRLEEYDKTIPSLTKKLAQKLKKEKALEIIKEKQVDVRMFIIYDLENYNKLQKNDYCKLTKTENDLLDEVLLCH